MRFTLDSTSEVSADEQPSPTVVRKSLPLQRTSLKADPQNFASSSATQTPTRKGILRHTSSFGTSTPTTQRRQRFQEHDGDTQQELSQSQRDSIPHTRNVHTSSPLPFQNQPRRRSATPAFEHVGVASTSSRSPSTSGLNAFSPGLPTRQQQRSAAQRQPPWMRSSLGRTPRSNATDFELDSSDDDNTALSSSEDEDDSGLLGADSDQDADEVDSDGSSSPQTSPYDQDESTDSDKEAWPVDRASSSRSHRIDARSRSNRRHGTPSAVKLASIAGDEWEDWNRNSAQLAWYRARASRRDASTPDAGSASLSRSRPVKATAPDADVDEVQALLSSLNMRRNQEEAEVKKAFEARNKDLWLGIDACILSAENEARKAAAVEAARLEAARKTREEAERKAVQARQAELDRIEAEKKAAHVEADRRKQEAEAEAVRQKQDEAEQAKARAMGGTGDDIRQTALKEYNEWMSKIRRIKTDVLPTVSSNSDLRKQCFAAKRQITPKVGQLTNSRQEINRITQAIAAVLDAAKQAAASGNGDVYTWILNHLSKCLIRQAEQEVAVKQDTAYPLARVVVWLLLLGHVELADVLMARLCKKCPWVVPVWPPRTKEMDEAAYRKVMGYKTSDETTENYSNRMNGITAFYFAILQTIPIAPPGQSNHEVEKIPIHFRSTSLWRWSVRALTPSSAGVAFLDHPLCPSIWSVFIEIAGPYTLKLYGKQMRKLFSLLLTQGLQGKKAAWLKHTEDKPYVKAATVRLELLLADWNASPGQAVIQNATKGVEMEP